MEVVCGSVVCDVKKDVADFIISWDQSQQTQGKPMGEKGVDLANTRRRFIACHHSATSDAVCA